MAHEGTDSVISAISPEAAPDGSRLGGLINRRETYLDHDLRCLLRAKGGKRKLLVVDRSFHIRTYQAYGIGSLG
jgi:hypothetical protein